MKKYFVVLMSVLCMLGLCACGGSVGNVKTHTVDSKVYTDADIASAIDVIKKEFKKEWKEVMNIYQFVCRGDEND